MAQSNQLPVAVVQMRSSRDLSTNVSRICSSIRDCASQGARVVVFPECALTGYFERVITNLTVQQIAAAEEEVARVCSDAGVHAIVGSVHREGGKLFNSAIVFAPSGKIIDRYHKIQLAERWPDGGDHLSVFKIDGVPCSIIISMTNGILNWSDCRCWPERR